MNNMRHERRTTRTPYDTDAAQHGRRTHRDRVTQTLHGPDDALHMYRTARTSHNTDTARHGHRTDATRYGHRTDATRYGHRTDATRYGDRTDATRYGDRTDAMRYKPRTDDAARDGMYGTPWTSCAARRKRSVCVCRHDTRTPCGTNTAPDRRLPGRTPYQTETARATRKACSRSSHPVHNISVAGAHVVAEPQPHGPHRPTARRPCRRVSRRSATHGAESASIAPAMSAHGGAVP